MMDRRHALAGMVAMFGAGLFAPLARAASSAPSSARRDAGSVFPRAASIAPAYIG